MDIVTRLLHVSEESEKMMLMTVLSQMNFEPGASDRYRFSI